MRKRVVHLLSVLALSVGAVVFVTSCKDTNEDMFNDLRNEIITPDGSLKEILDKQVDNLEDKIDKLQKQVDGIEADYVTKDVFDKTIQDLQKKIDDIKSCECDMASVLKRIADLEKASIEANQKIKAAMDLAGKNSDRIDGLELQITSMSDSLKTAFETAAEAKAKAELNAGHIDGLDKKYAEILLKYEEVSKTIDEQIAIVTKAYLEGDKELNERIDSLKGVVADNKDLIDSLANELKTTNANVEKALELSKDVPELKKTVEEHIAKIATLEAFKETVEKTLEEQGKAIEANTVKLGEIEEAYKAADEIMQKEIETLQKEVRELKDAIDDIKENLANMVTSVIVQGTYTPAFGSINLPFNVNSNILLTYYGEANHDVMFPTSNTGNYVYEKQALTAADMKMIGASEKPLFTVGQPILSSEDSNAGTLYMTINPNTVDFTGLNLNLENSQGVPSYVELGEVKKSDKTLGFGYTRAAENGFYEAPAFVAAENIDKVQKVNFNTEVIKSSVKDVIDAMNNGKSFNVAQLAGSMYTVVSNLNMDANALKCEWQEVDGTSHSVYSNYNVAATAVKPLPLTWLKDINVEKVPFYDRVIALLDKVSGAVHKEIDVIFDNINGSPLVESLRGLEIKHIELDDLDEDLLAQFKVVVEIDTVLNTGKQSVHLDLEQDVDVPIKFEDEVVVEAPVPTFVIDEDGEAVLCVPVKDENDNIVGYTKLPMGSAAIVDGSLEIDNEIKVPIKIDEHQNVTIKIDKIVEFDGPSIRFTYKKEIDLTGAIEELWGNVGDQIGGVNEMLDQLKGLVDNVNKMLDDINDYEGKFNGTVDDYMARIREMIDRWNNRIVGMINDINSRLQPVMFAGSMDKVAYLSQVRTSPTVLNGSNIRLTPTTWSFELAVPVCRKHVAVTNVFNGSSSAQAGDAACLSALKAANAAANMNEVIDGNIRNIQVSGLKSGLTYEVAYSALDFHGNISTQKYYIAIK